MISDMPILQADSVGLGIYSLCSVSVKFAPLAKRQVLTSPTSRDTLGCGNGSSNAIFVQSSGFLPIWFHSSCSGLILGGAWVSVRGAESSGVKRRED
jgi:hypothetical protein